MRTPTTAELADWREIARTFGLLDEVGRILPGGFHPAGIEATVVRVRCVTYLSASMFVEHPTGFAVSRFERTTAGEIVLRGASWVRILQLMLRGSFSRVPASVPTTSTEILAAQHLISQMLATAEILDARLPKDTDTVEVFLRDLDDNLVANEAFPPGTEIEMPYKLRTKLALLTSSVLGLFGSRWEQLPG